MAAGASAGALVARAVYEQVEESNGASHAVDVLPACVGCTGCVPVCPTAAIVVRPGGISIVDDDCISCGY